MASLLTPSLRDSPALDSHRKTAWSLLRARYQEVSYCTPTTNNSQASVEERTYDEADTSLQALRARYSRHTVVAVDNNDTEEYKRYKSLPGANVATLTWWKANETMFPKMAVIARKILAVTASSASTERLFSTVGNVFTKKRQRMHVSTARVQVLLHENHHL